MEHRGGWLLSVFVWLCFLKQGLGIRPGRPQNQYLPALVSKRNYILHNNCLTYSGGELTISMQDMLQ